ncbi:MAG: hypothetical protein AAGA38_01515 [Pseudomonadota bacterium]
MSTGIKRAIGAVTAVVLVLGLVRLTQAPGTPSRVFVPSEQITGRAAGHDTVHALQDIVESPRSVGDAVFQTANPVVAERETDLSDDDLQAEAKALFQELGGTDLSPLARLTLKRKWDLAETPEAQVEVLSRLRATLAAR